MVKLSKEAKQRLQQLFKGGQFAIRWGFIPLVIYLAYFGDEGLFGHLDLEAVMDRRNMEGVHAGWDKKWDLFRLSPFGWHRALNRCI
nr:mitochondrial import receptor subunit TOM7 homolog [Dasypus novemcinctus]